MFDSILFQEEHPFQTVIIAYSLLMRAAFGDRILLRVKDNSGPPVFTKPLRPNGQTFSRWGTIAHETLVGKGSRSVVVTDKARELRMHLPTLDEYVTLTPRRVTPVYPADANLIISLLDLHVSPSRSSDQLDGRVEILEAGTGHGALTLYLARAVHGANPPCSMETSESSKAALVAEPSSGEKVSKWANVREDWKSQRRGIIHTVDISLGNSQHAQGVVEGFRQGMYTGDVDFHVGEVSDWIDRRLAMRPALPENGEGQSFLAHAILDMPSSYRHLEKVSTALRANGVLIAFNPSMTQIIACVEEIRKKKLQLILDRVLELGLSMTGGREWDVRAFKPRALVRKDTKTKDSALDQEDISCTGSNEDGEASSASSADAEAQNADHVQAYSETENNWAMICRPKVGNRIIGGGFLGVWRKMRNTERAVSNS